MEQNNITSYVKGNKVIGILGGMGPFATAIFYTNLLESCGSTLHDSEYPSVIISSNTQIPSRTRAFLFGEEDPSSLLIKEIEKLESSGASFFVCPCNSAHYFLKKIVSDSLIKVPFLDMVDLTIDKCERELNKIIILGGEVTINSRMYSSSIYQAIYPNQTHQKQVRNLIDMVKQNKTAKLFDYTTELLHDLMAYHNTNNFLIGCTELSYIPKKYLSINFINSSQVLIDEILKKLKGE